MLRWSSSEERPKLTSRFEVGCKWPPRTNRSSLLRNCRSTCASTRQQFTGCCVRANFLAFGLAAIGASTAPRLNNGRGCKRRNRKHQRVAGATRQKKKAADGGPACFSSFDKSPRKRIANGNSRWCRCSAAVFECARCAHLRISGLRQKGRSAAIC